MPKGVRPPLVEAKDCAQCGKTFAPHGNRQRYCSLECKQRALFGETTCGHCGVVFVRARREQTFCSSACWYAAPGKKVLDSVTCARCEKAFHPGSVSQRYCSVECSNAAKTTTRRLVTCEACGKQFETRLRAPRFCSRACSRKGQGRRGSPIGTTRMAATGYIEMKTERGWRLAHRVIMERHLGRELSRREIVHHRNGDRTDNQIANLQLWIGNHPPGASEKHCPTCTCFAH